MGKRIGIPNSRHIAPLSVASGQYLQVLLDSISLRNDGDGATLEVQFGDDTPAIWSRHGRSEVFKHYLPQLKEAPVVQEEIDRIVIDHDPNEHFRGADFPFRYVSGGSLPILRHRKKSYYCLFYRENYPIGWNIANGGADSLHELLDPIQTLERELREEMLIIDPRRKLRFNYDTSDSGPPPSLTMATALAFERFTHLGKRDAYATWDCALKWLGGPDKLIVRSGAGHTKQFPDIYLNVTAADCAIEVDRVAYLDLDDDAVIIHGETLDQELLDSPVGLFEVGKVNDAVRTQPRGKREFVPDILFHGGKRFNGSAFEDRLEKHFLPRVRPHITKDDLSRFRTAQRQGRALDLCPVTDGIIRRTARAEAPAREETHFDTFLSHPTHPRATQVFDYLTRRLRRTVFYSNEAHATTNFFNEIDNAIEQADDMVVYGTTLAHFRHDWVCYEYQRFILDMMKRNGRPGLRLFCLAPGLDPDDMPPALQLRSRIINKVSLDDCLEELGQWLSKPRTGSRP
ncbi:MAG: hypothetical protein ABSD21_02545 [Rhizomicrobium sp.]|jgi:hypothetical protein